jgi:hypothetical protein
LAALAVSLLSACGINDRTAPATLPGAAEQLLTQAEVDRYPVGSPAHAVLAWWRNAQFANLTGFRDAYSRPLRARLETSPLTAQSLAFFSGTIRDARPRIQEVTVSDATAVVTTLIEYREPVGTTRYITSTLPRAFTLIREDGKWRLTDDLFVQTSVPPAFRRTTGS